MFSFSWQSVLLFGRWCWVGLCDMMSNIIWRNKNIFRLFYAVLFISLRVSHDRHDNVPHLNYCCINVVKNKSTSPNNLILNTLKLHQYSFFAPMTATVLSPLFSLQQWVDTHMLCSQFSLPSFTNAAISALFKFLPQILVKRQQREGCVEVLCIWGKRTQKAERYEQDAAEKNSPKISKEPTEASCQHI